MQRSNTSNTSDKSITERRRTVRGLFAALLVTVIAAAVCITVWLIRRDTPAKAIRTTMTQISSLDESSIGSILADGMDASDTEDAVSAFSRFFSDFSCRVLSVSQDNDTAQAQVRITAPDARLIAADIRLSQMEEESTLNPSDGKQIYSILNRLLSDNDYPSVSSEGTVYLTKTRNGWEVRYTDELTSLILGGLPEALADPYLLSPQQYLTAYLGKLDSMSAAQWGELFGVNDLFSTYSSNYEQIDAEFLTRAKEAFSFTVGQADTDGPSSEVSADITAVDTASILAQYKEKLIRYGKTFDAVKDDSAALSEKSAQLLLDAIRENEAVSTFRILVPLENNGTGWNVTDTSALSDALLGGVSDAASGFAETSQTE